MRLKKEMIEHISKKLANSLLDEEFIIFDGKRDELAQIIKLLITEDLGAEDRLNEEVKEIIHTHHDLLDKSDTDYGKVFQMVKTKLARERGLVL